MALTRPRPSALQGQCRLGALWVWVALGLLQAASAADGHPGDAATANSTVVTPTAGTEAAASKRSSLPPGCRTFYAHGTARRGLDGEEYTTQLLWREHAVQDDAGRWTLAVNVTATEEARVVLSGAARNLPGQPRYELVLAALANESRLLVHAKHHIRGSEASAAPLLRNRPLFEDGSLQLRLLWKVDGVAGSDTKGRLDVMVKPAEAAVELLLFSYETTMPLQVETFSFGSTHPGDVDFTVCKAAGGDGERAGVGAGAGADLGLGVPGCRSLILHKSNLDHAHELAVGWSDVADSHGRLQFWARASTDVEVIVSERLHPRRHLHHVVFGGDFNTKTWVIDARRRALGRAAEVSTPTLLSDTQFRPLWVSVPPHPHARQGVVKAGSGEVPHGHHNGTQLRELVSWFNKDAPAVPNFVTFATFRNRLVHILFDCENPPSLPAANQSGGVALLDAVRGSVAAAFASPRAPHSSPPTLELDIERLGMHNGSVTATGTLLQVEYPNRNGGRGARHTPNQSAFQEWQYENNSGVEWNPAWFEGMLKSQYWLTDMDELLDKDAISNLFVVSSEDGGKNSLKLAPGPIQKGIAFCSITAKLNSESNNCIELSISNLDPKWKVDWSVGKTAKSGKCTLNLIVRTRYHAHEKYEDPPKSTLNTGLLLWMYVLCTLVALITLCTGSHPTGNKVHSLFSVSKRIICKFYHQKNFQDEICIVAYEGGAAHIHEQDHLNTDGEKLNKRKPEPAKKVHSAFMQNKVPIILLSTSLCLSATDLFMRLANT